MLVTTRLIPVSTYLFKVNKTCTRTRSEICLELAIKTPDDAIIVALVFLFLTLNVFTRCSSVCIVNFEYVIAGWDEICS